MPALTVTAILSDAWNVYRLLFRRSIPIALVVYVLIDSLDLLDDLIDNDGVRISVVLIGGVLAFAGPVFVQGALVRIVRNVHEGERPEPARWLLSAAWRRLPSLAGASIVYAVGLLVGLLLLIVPGLIAAARWALMAPAIMLEGRETMPAQARSRAIVAGEIDNGLGDRTRLALGVVVTSFLVTTAIPGALGWIAYDYVWNWVTWALTVVVGALLAPYQAHVLSVLYYRLVDPQRPAVDPRVWAWPSVWRGIPESA